MWRQCVDHIMVEVCNMKEASQGDFSGVHTHPWREEGQCWARPKSSLLVTRVHGLVKLFENGLALKKEVKLACQKRKSAQAVPLGGWGR